MLTQKNIFWILSVLSLLFITSQVPAQTSTLANLGNAAPINNHGVSTYVEYNDQDDGYKVLATDQDTLYPSIDQTVRTEVSYGGSTSWAQTSAYDVHGYLDSPTKAVDLGNLFLDELYFETVDGAAASLDLNFDLNFTVTVIDPTQDIDGFFYLHMSEMSTYGGLDKESFSFLTEDAGGDKTFYATHATETYTGLTHENFVDSEGKYVYTFSETITLSTDGWGSDKTTGLIDSGTYLPFGIWVGAYTDVGNMIIDYSNSMTLNPDNPYCAYDASGNQLSSTAFSLTSLENFDQPASVPVPGSIVLALFGSGLVGTLFKRRGTPEGQTSTGCCPMAFSS